jgi:hypothetical protein
MQHLEPQSPAPPCPDCGRADATLTDQRPIFRLWNIEREEPFSITNVFKCKCGRDFTENVWAKQQGVRFSDAH